MFRLSQYLRELDEPAPSGPVRQPPGPVVIWNLIRRCNLTCKHCYSISGDVDFPGELSTEDVFHVMNDLKMFRVPVLILSGGEPLMRRDIFEISERAKTMKFYVGLSSNGTLVDASLADRIRDIGYDYVGISLDGIGATHDRFRGRAGAYEEALSGLRLLRDRGIKVGVRFTMTEDNAAELPRLLDLVEREEFPKFYLSHLVYAGRGNKNRGTDAAWQTTRDAMDMVIARAWRWARGGSDMEIVTGNNDADAVYLLQWAARNVPHAVASLREKLVRWGGNSSGVNVANIDNLGNVHPDTMWWHYNLGNVKKRPFSEIWSDVSDPVMAGLKRQPRLIGGRCGSCAHFSICNGNTRVRALRMTGNPWAEDPGCYLTAAEIGLAEPAERVRTSAFIGEPAMKRRYLTSATAALFALALHLVPAAAEPDAARLYADHCAQCHGADRLGQLGPALLPENLGRLAGARAVSVIVNGRAATQMPGFAGALSNEEIAALAAYIATPLAGVPAWGAEEISASRLIHASAPALERPRFDADPMNLFVVVEAGDHHATILDGDRFEPLARFATRFALHGGPKFSPDGRFVFFMSRDGWVSKYDLWTLTMLAEVRAGINARNIAISRDGKHIAVANYLPHTLVMLSADDLSVEKIFDVKDKKGNSSRVSAVYQARPRDSFIAALKDVPEIWEVATDPNAPPVYSGLVHSHEKGMIEALPSSQGLFALRRIETPEPLDDFFFDPSYRNLIGSAREGRAVVVNLVVGRDIKRLDMPGLPHLGSGISWTWQGRPVMATPLLKEGRISVLDMQDWSPIKTIETPGPGFFMRSHENSPYAWTDSMMGGKKDTLSIIDKRTLEIVRSVTPEPGKTAAHVEFDKDGRHVLVSVWEDKGALVVYDAATFAEVKRLPMSKPSGKYNVWNKITFSDGTSH